MHYIDDENINLIIDKLFKILSAKRSRNQIRRRYYEHKNTVKNIGLAVKPEYECFFAPLSWASKAVDMLANRSVFDGVSLINGEDKLLTGVFSDNNFTELYHEANTDAMISSFSLITLSQGLDDEPQYVMSAYDAETSAAIWDYRKKRIAAAITVIDFCRKSDMTYLLNEPKEFNLYLPNAVIMFSRESRTDSWRHNVIEHSVGRCLVEPIRYSPTINRPLGRSRINRSVMGIVDCAVRETLRSEITAEACAAPQKYLLNVADDIFGDETKTDQEKALARYRAEIGALLVASSGDDARDVKYGQLEQVSMSSHISYLRSLANNFAGATSLPVSSLGIAQDNPPSAEAIYASKEDLITEARKVNRTNGASIRNLSKMIFALENNRNFYGITDDQKSVEVEFLNPAMPAIVSQADAISKIVAAIPAIANSEVILQNIGFTNEEIQRLKPYIDRYESQSIIDEIVNSGADNITLDTPATAVDNNG